MTTKMLPYQPGFSPRHARTTRPRELAQIGERQHRPPGPNDPVPPTMPPAPPLPRPKPRPGSSWLMTVLGLLALEPGVWRRVFRELRSRWLMARPQSAAQGAAEAYEVSRWLIEVRSPALPPIALLRASTLTIGWLREQLRPDPPVHDLVLYFRLWCLAEGISA